MKKFSATNHIQTAIWIFLNGEKEERGTCTCEIVGFCEKSMSTVPIIASFALTRNFKTPSSAPKMTFIEYWSTVVSIPSIFFFSNWLKSTFLKSIEIIPICSIAGSLLVSLLWRFEKTRNARSTYYCCHISQERRPNHKRTDQGTCIIYHRDYVVSSDYEGLKYSCRRISRPVRWRMSIWSMKSPTMCIQTLAIIHFIIPVAILRPVNLSGCESASESIPSRNGIHRLKP